MRFFDETWAILLRYKRRKVSIWNKIGAIALAVGIILLIGIGFDKVIDFSKYGMSYTQFFSPGIIAYFIAVGGLSSAVSLVSDRKGFTKYVLVTPISRYALLAGEILEGITGPSQALLIAGVIFLLFFSKITFISLLLFMLLTILCIVGFYAFGLWFSTLFKRRETAMKITGFANFFMLFLSGIVYPISAMPKFLQYIMYSNPVAYAVDLFRYVMVGKNHFPLLLSIGFLGIFFLASITAGIYYFEKNLRK
jgi:ABC-2 type transport system permease protein